MMPNNRKQRIPQGLLSGTKQTSISTFAGNGGGNNGKRRNAEEEEEEINNIIPTTSLSLLSSSNRLPSRQSISIMRQRRQSVQQQRRRSSSSSSMAVQPFTVKSARKSIAKQRAASFVLSSTSHHNNRGRRRSVIKTASDFVSITKSSIEFEMIQLEQKLELLDAISEMSQEDKLDLLFDLLDTDNDETISALELAAGLKKVNTFGHGSTDISFTERLNVAIDRIATADTTHSGSLDKSELQILAGNMSNDIGCTLQEFIEMMIYVILDNTGNDDNNNDIEEDDKRNLSLEEVTEAVRNEEDYRLKQNDYRLKLLFNIFDLDGDGSVDFKEFVLGVYKMTDDVEDRASKAAMTAMLMFDNNTTTIEDDTDNIAVEDRTLNYKSFCILMINLITAACNNNNDDDFDNALDSLILNISSYEELDEEEEQITLDNVSKQFAMNEDELKNLLLMSDARKRRTTTPAALSNQQLEEDEDTTSSKDGHEHYEEEEERELSAIEYSKIYKLFELWDIDSDNYIDFKELEIGLRKFHGSSSSGSSSSSGNTINDIVFKECLSIINKFDETNNCKLDFGEFVTFITKFASMTMNKNTSVDKDNNNYDLHELLDFMIVCSTIKDYQKSEQIY